MFRDPGHVVREIDQIHAAMVCNSPKHLRAGAAIRLEPGPQALDAQKYQRPDRYEVPGQALHGAEEAELGHRRHYTPGWFGVG
ncbi:hypothetical protein HY30_00095 [Hyphomonas chukchiensis]|uniref:Uncharacterized protein n=1 Tax=Hyphomonas chukchiensis TaxID=1280947 RepID=A0A062ULL4_9PROT|nr:hypothetical protein HY30_00095 [Hyphomonas chukchiensis]